MSRRFLYTILTVLIIGVLTGVAIFLAKGYRFSAKTGQISGTGIMSITSLPDQASVYLDGHLTTATNANIDSLPPKVYDVRITKEGFIPWEKKIEVKEGLVSQIKATLFPAIPTVYPLTFSGVDKVVISPDTQRLAFIVPDSASTADAATSALSGKKSGIYVWEMISGPLNFTSGPEPHRIGSLIPGLDYSKAIVRWSEDSTQVLVSLPDRSLLFDENKFGDIGRDITATSDPTLTTWDQEKSTKDLSQYNSIKDENLKKEASGSALIKWSPDETKFITSKDGKSDFKLVDLSTSKILLLPKITLADWLPDSRHLVLVEEQAGSKDSNQNFPYGRIFVIETDGSNKSEVYAGNFNTTSVFPWPDGSRLVIVSSVPTPTGNTPNLFGINLK